MSLTPSHIVEYLFCNRFTYFEYVLGIPQYEDRRYKVLRGRELHDSKLEQNKDYLRKRIGVKEKLLNPYLTNNNLRGIVDEVLLLNDDSMAPLDYKFAVYKDTIYKTHKIQIFCYAWLIEHNFNRPVNKGYLVYTRSKNKLIEVPISKEDKLNISIYIEDIYRIIDKNVFPNGTKERKRCFDCTYRNICIK